MTSKMHISSCPKCAGRPRSSEREARLQDLVHTAGQLFLKHGYRNVSLEMLARECHVAVRTIYVKFGGKAGLLHAVLVANRERFFNTHDMENDQRPLKEIVSDFGAHFLDLVSMPEALSMTRMVIADAPGNVELGQTFFDAGPKQTRDMLMRFFARPDIRAQLRDDVELDLLPVFLLNCITGDQYSWLIFGRVEQSRAQVLREMEQRLDLFYRSVLRPA
ncbi:MAG: TetR family transcriptional regulator [Massilia sp.]|jgi:TetR/AcrR family transcriptional repressor of mexJK operon|nr:TetR family transcriptional regulator [Massilia sp.]MDB5950023.1 TetR family transcriptional regulator [Massilia sp.]